MHCARVDRVADRAAAACLGGLLGLHLQDFKITCSAPHGSLTHLAPWLVGFKHSDSWLGVHATSTSIVDPEQPSSGSVSKSHRLTAHLPVGLLGSDDRLDVLLRERFLEDRGEMGVLWTDSSPMHARSTPR